MNYKLLLVAPAILLLTNCKTKAQNETKNSDGIVTIELNKKTAIPGSKIALEFNQVTEDSRCPVDVTCVWEGIAIVNLKANNGTETKNIQLATKDFEPKNTKKSTDFDGYKISLIDVKPYPGGKQGPKSITLKYEKE